MSFKCLVTKFDLWLLKIWCIFTTLNFLFYECHVMSCANCQTLGSPLGWCCFSPLPFGRCCGYFFRIGWYCLLPPSLEWRCPAHPSPLEWCFFPTSCFWVVLLFLSFLQGGVEFLSSFWVVLRCPPRSGWCCFLASFWVVVDHKLFEKTQGGGRSEGGGAAPPEWRRVRHHHPVRMRAPPNRKRGSKQHNLWKKMGCPSPSCPLSSIPIVPVYVGWWRSSPSSPPSPSGRNHRPAAPIQREWGKQHHPHSVGGRRAPLQIRRGERLHNSLLI